MTLIESLNVTTSPSAANVTWLYAGVHPYQLAVGLFDQGVLVREYVVAANSSARIVNLEVENGRRFHSEDRYLSHIAVAREVLRAAR